MYYNFAFNGVWWMYFNSSRKNAEQRQQRWRRRQRKKSVVFSSSFFLHHQRCSFYFCFFRSSAVGSYPSLPLPSNAINVCFGSFFSYYFMATSADISFGFYSRSFLCVHIPKDDRAWGWCAGNTYAHKQVDAQRIPIQTAAEAAAAVAAAVKITISHRRT